jgi:hypothetical protein
MGTYVFLGVKFRSQMKGEGVQAGFRSQMTVEADQAACSARFPRLLGVLDLRAMFRFCYACETEGLPFC